MPKITQQQKDAIRKDILNTARNVFIEKGYEATSMKDIVTSSGRSFGGVYLYFSNKEEVFLELLRDQYENMSYDFALETELSAWNRFIHFMREQESRIRDAEEGLAPCMYEYFILGRKQESRMKLIEERYQAVYASIHALLKEGLHNGEFNPSQPIETLVHWIISSMDGLFIESIMNGSERIEFTKQFDLLQTVIRSILIPTESRVFNDE